MEMPVIIIMLLTLSLSLSVTLSLSAHEMQSKCKSLQISLTNVIISELQWAKVVQWTPKTRICAILNYILIKPHAILYKVASTS